MIILLQAAAFTVYVSRVKVTNIWQMIRGALYGAQWRVPTSFIMYGFFFFYINVITFELS